MKKSEVASLKQHIKRRVPPYLILLNPLVSQSIIQILKMRLMKPGKNWALMQFLNTMESYTPIIQVKKTLSKSILIDKKASLLSKKESDNFK